MLQFGMRLGQRPRTVITTTPRPIKILKELVKIDDGSVAITRGTTYDNRENLAPGFFSQIVKRYEGTRLGRQELQAEILEDVQGALWSRDLIEAGRIRKEDAPEMARIVVAVDPAISVSEISDETGIVVAGLGRDGEGYVLADLSGKFSPVEWASKAVAAFHKWKADRIVAESNQGGAMVEATIRTVEPNAPITLVHASRGKVARAEPVSALYEQCRIHHVGMFAELEDQLCSFEPGAAKSPDRLDALVWAISALMLNNDNVYNNAIEFFRREIVLQGMSLPADDAAPEMVRIRAPEGVNQLCLMSGRSLSVPPDRIVEVAAEDAAPLLVVGFTRI
jgi:phage terminase large subunit-like protein